MLYGNTNTRNVSWQRDITVLSDHTPQIWTEHSSMFATCMRFRGKKSSDMSMYSRSVFEARLMQALRDDWGVLIPNFRLQYSTGKVEVIFEDEEEFIIAKISNGEINS
jgi:hypothetical protein